VGGNSPHPLFICGANTPWDNHNATWNNFGGDYDADWWDSHYSQFNSNGLNGSRVWITCSGEVGINIDETGYVSGATTQHWADLDSFFAIAQNCGVYIMATLMSFDHFSENYSTYQRWRNWINSDINIDSYISNYVTPFVQRYGANTALWSIDLINEPDWATNTEGGTIEWERFQNYFAKAAKAIHDNSNVLVTVGIAVIKYNSDNTPGSMGNKVSDAALQTHLSDPAVHLDFWSPHWYDWMNPYWSTPMYITPTIFNLDSSKPAVIGENPANGTEGHSLLSDIQGAYLNGWSGIMPWTSNGVDNNGGWVEVSTATRAFAQTLKELVLTSPNGGENLRAGATCNIAWTASNITENLVIELLQNDNLVGTIATGIDPATSIYLWTVGQLLEGGGLIKGTNFKILIRTESGAQAAVTTL